MTTYLTIGLYAQIGFILLRALTDKLPKLPDEASGWVAFIIGMVIGICINVVFWPAAIIAEIDYTIKGV